MHPLRNLGISLCLGAGVTVPPSVQAQAESLTKVYETSNGEVTYVDSGSVQTVGSSKRYWEVTKLPVPDQHRVVLRRTYFEVDCNARMSAQRAFVDYDEQGTVVASESWLDQPVRWRPIVPGSNGEVVRLLICRNS